MSEQIAEIEHEDSSEKHCFLDYRALDVHFIYGFLWEASIPITTGVFVSGIPQRRGASHSAKGWISPFIHERVIGGIRPNSIEDSWIGTYQPTFMMQRRCLEKTAKRPFSASLIAPLENDVLLPTRGAPASATQELAVQPVQVSWTIRLFSSGTGTFTIRIALRDLDKVQSHAERFRRIHHLLRLVPNMDVIPEAHKRNVRWGVLRHRPIADSFLSSPTTGTRRLFDVMRTVRDSTLRGIPSHLFSSKDSGRMGPRIRADETGLAYQNERSKNSERSLRDITAPVRRRGYRNETWGENQSPFTFVTAVLSPASMSVLRSPSAPCAKEFGSIYARLTLDNRSADRDFLHLTEQYLAQAMRYDQNSQMLPNYSHDDRLFFTFCRRGAVAATASPDQLPALFVVPSLLNLFEIIRARLLAGLTLSVRLSDIANRLAPLNPDAVPIEPTAYAHLRNLVVANLENPLEYLFDGGSAAEMALCAEDALFVRRTWDEVRRSFDVVDRLMSAWETARFKKKYED